MRSPPIALMLATLVLAACSANAPQDASTPAAASTHTPAAPQPEHAAASAVAPVDTTHGASARGTAAVDAGGTDAAAHSEGHAATAAGQADAMAGMEHGATPSTATPAGGAQAGWYTGGTFQPCGSAQRLKVDTAAKIDAQVKAGGMSPSDPVYVRLEGKAAGDAFTVSRVAQVGSPTPVRDCPMTGTTTQG